MNEIKPLEFGKEFVTKAIPYGILRSSRHVCNLICYAFIGFYQIEAMTIGVGLALACNAFFASLLISQASSVVGIYSIKYKGSKNFKLMRLSFYEGIF